MFHNFLVSTDRSTHHLRSLIDLSVLLLALGIRCASAQYLNVTEGPVIRYNDTGFGLHLAGFTGKWDNGDTHASAWMDNGSELITYNDGTMPIPVAITGSLVGPNYSNIGLDVMTGGGAYLSLASANPLVDFGFGSQTNYPIGWNDNRTWKTSGIAPYNGCVYMTVQRQEDYDVSPAGGVLPSVNNGFRNGSSSILKSCDHGATWVNFWNSTPQPGGNPPPGNHQMWRVGTRWYANTIYAAGDYVLDVNGHNQLANTGGVTGNSSPAWNASGGLTTDGGVTWTDVGPAIAGFVPVTYCQDNTIGCPAYGADDYNGGPYLYLTALGAGDTGHGSYSNYYLARVFKSDFPLLDVSKYQYWRGQPGADIFAAANWGSSMVGAQPVLRVTGLRSQVYYLTGINRYLLVHDTAHGTFEFWIAASLAGPWLKTGYTTAGQDFPEFPSILMSTVQMLSTNPPQVSFILEYGSSSGSDWNDQVFPLDRRYSSTFKTITLTESLTSAVNAEASSYSDSLSKQALVADLAFLPELGATITDYSGTGHTATASYSATPNTGSNYSPAGLWFNASNPGNDSITGTYSVSVPARVTGPFTLFLAYRKLQQPQPGECLVSSTQVSICRNGSNHNDWQVRVGTTTTEWSDASTFSGQYYNTGWDGAWNMFVIDYSGSAVYTYNQYTVSAGPYPNVPLSGGLNNSNFVLGSNNFSGEIARFVVYDRSLTADEIRNTTDILLSDLSTRNVYLSRPAKPGEPILDSQGVPLAAWSVRRVLSSWHGPLISVSNTRFGYNLDLSADVSGNLDPVTLQSFCNPVTDCSVIRIYDQTGHGNTLTLESLPNHTTALTTCGSSHAYCIYDDGYNAYTTPSDFFFYGFTGGVTAVMSVDQPKSGPASTYLQLVDTVANPGATPSLLVAVQGDATNTNMAWQRGGLSPNGLAVANGTPFVVFSWFDSYLEHFLLNNNNLADAVLTAAFPTQVRFQAYGFQMGSLGSAAAPGAAGYFSEVFLWDQALSTGHVREIGRNQASYFGTPYIF